MSPEVTAVIYTASVWILPVLLAITLHEAAHGFAAWRLGDDTAKQAGRLSLNPLRHVDRFGTVILPAMLLLLQSPFLFGWAKPVPVNFYRLRHPRRDMVLVALAGPGTNLLLAAIAAMLFRVVPLLPETIDLWVGRNLYHAILINLVLAVFNMLPLPPLDGGRVAVGLLPRPLAEPLAKLERYGFFILIGVIFLLPMIGRQLGYNLNVFDTLVMYPVEKLSGFYSALAGFDLRFF
jgi:Zn-dependent protease